MNRYSRSGQIPSNSSKLPKWHYWVYWVGVVCVLMAALTAFGPIKWPKGRGHAQQNGTKAVANANLRRPSPSGFVSGQRRLYPYSVIPGGVESPQEFRNAFAHDPQVARLYADFDFPDAHIERLTSDREVYVAYRYDNRIYWTKKRLLLRAGETVITDGKETGRTRCGNRISETPMQPVRQNEPPNAAQNAPIAEVAPNTGLLPTLPMESPFLDPLGNGLALLPEGSTTPSLNPPPFFPLVGGGPGSFPSVTPPPVATPEPGALPLLALGFVALGLIAMLRGRKPRKA